MTIIDESVYHKKSLVLTGGSVKIVYVHNFSGVPDIKRDK